MTPLLKNLLTALVALSLAYAGYYVYTQSKNSDLSLSGDASLTDDMLVKTQKFIEYRSILDGVRVDVTIFDDPVFRSYKTFSTPVNEQPVGRKNPFNRTSPSEYINGN